MAEEIKKEEISLSDAEKKLDQADSVITKAWNILKKHWGKLLIFLLIYGGYKFCVLVGEEMDKPQQEQVQPVYVIGDTTTTYDESDTAQYEEYYISDSVTE